MEEIKVDLASLASQTNSLALFNYIIDKSRRDGVQIGVTWNKEVYDYLFESGININVENILGYHIVDIDMQENII